MGKRNRAKLEAADDKPVVPATSSVPKASIPSKTATKVAGKPQIVAKGGDKSASKSKRPPTPPSEHDEDDDEDSSDESDVIEGDDDGSDDGEGSDVEHDDGDDDSVDSDTSGTISEDLDLNKVNDGDSDDDDSSDDEEDEDEDDGEGGRTVTVDFDFKDPQQIDFLSLRNLLSRYLPPVEASTQEKAKKSADGDKEDGGDDAAVADEASGTSDSDADDAGGGSSSAAAGGGRGRREKKTVATIVGAFNPSELAEAIIDQVEIGTTVKAGDDPDVYAFVTALPLHSSKPVPAVKLVTEYMMKKCPKKKRAQFRAALSNKKTALLLNERMLNMPAQIAPNLHKCFVDDLDWAVQQAGGKDQFDFKQFLLMSAQFQMKSAVKKKPAKIAGEPSAKKRKGDEESEADSESDDEAAEEDGDAGAEAAAAGAGRGGEAKAGLDGADEKLGFYKWEDEVLAESATMQFTFGVNPTGHIEGNAPQYRTVMIVSARKYFDAVSMMQLRLAEAIAADEREKAAADAAAAAKPAK